MGGRRCSSLLLRTALRPKIGSGRSTRGRRHSEGDRLNQHSSLTVTHKPRATASLHQLFAKGDRRSSEGSMYSSSRTHAETRARPSMKSTLQALTRRPIHTTIAILSEPEYTRLVHALILLAEAALTLAIIHSVRCTLQTSTSHHKRRSAMQWNDPLKSVFTCLPSHEYRLGGIHAADFTGRRRRARLYQDKRRYRASSVSCHMIKV